MKLNLVKKNEEYKALQNQIAHDKAAMGKYEDHVLHGYETVEAQAAELAKFEAEVKQFAQEVEKLKADLETQAVSQQAQLAEIEATITNAEDSVPIDQREQYRRNVRQRGPTPSPPSRGAPASAATPPSPPRCSTNSSTATSSPSATAAAGSSTSPRTKPRAPEPRENPRARPNAQRLRPSSVECLKYIPLPRTLWSFGSPRPTSPRRNRLPPATHDRCHVIRPFMPFSTVLTPNPRDCIGVNELSAVAYPRLGMVGSGALIV